MAVAIKRKCLIPLQSQSGTLPNPCVHKPRCQATAGAQPLKLAADCLALLHTPSSAWLHVCWKQPQLAA